MTTEKKPNTKCEQANHVRGDTKLTALISATPPTEFKEPKGRESCIQQHDVLAMVEYHFSVCLSLTR
jgi:hypothetical protein